MPNIKSAIKRMRQSKKREERNKRVKSAIRTLVKKIRKNLEEGKIEEAKKLLPLAQSVIEKAGARNVIHWKAASRKVSKLFKKVMMQAQKV